MYVNTKGRAYWLLYHYVYVCYVFSDMHSQAVLLFLGKIYAYIYVCARVRAYYLLLRTYVRTYMLYICSSSLHGKPKGKNVEH